jgi:hypothetical protein
MRGAIDFPGAVLGCFKRIVVGEGAGILLVGTLMLSLAGCVAYDPYPSPTYYYPPAEYYVTPAPSYYYYRPCCATYFDFGYWHGDGRYGRGRR